MGALKCRASTLAFFAFFCLHPTASYAQSSVEKNNSATEEGVPGHILDQDNLSEAADSLYSILKEGKKSGFITTKNEDVTSKVEPDEINGVYSANSRNCDAVEILDFAAFKSITGYEDISAAKIASNKMGGEASALYMAKVYLSLGLGDEAINLLKTYDTPQALILKDVANILMDPQKIRPNNALRVYQKCGHEAFLWAVLDNPKIFEADISGQKRRVLLRTLKSFPDPLSEILSISVAIRAAENNQIVFSDAIWLQMENNARELKQTLPEDKTDRHDLIYLNALLSERLDPEYTSALLKYLAERDGVYQMAALKKLSNISRRGGHAGGQKIESDLLALSEKAVGSETGQSAAMELVKNRLHQGDARNAIAVTRKYFEETDPEYVKSAISIRTLVEDRLNSETLLNRIVGLNDYLDDTQFFYASGDVTSLKYSAIKAAIASGLPELHSSIIEKSENVSSETAKLLREASFFQALKFNTDIEVKEAVENFDLSEEGLNRVMQYALAKNDVPLAKSILPKLANSDQKPQFTSAIAWLEGRWADTDTPLDQTDDKTQADQQSIPASKYLTTAVVKPVTTAERAWVDMLPQHLIDVETAVSNAKAFLNNG
jgi:hypothetical protein